MKALFVVSLALILIGCGQVKTTLPAYTVTGKVVDGRTGAGIPDAILTFGGYTVKTVEDGQWTLVGLTGTVTINVYKEGWAFTPASKQVSGPESITFVGDKRVFDGYGYVYDSHHNPISGVTISFSNGKPAVVTDSNGRWSAANFNEAVTVTPTYGSYRFSPASAQISATQTQADFVLYSLYAVSGRITDNQGIGVSGVKIMFTPSIAGDVYTNELGEWSQSGLYGTVTAYPSKTGWNIDPLYWSLSGPKTNADFTARSMYSVSGVVLDPAGNPMPSVRMQLDNGRYTYTDVFGKWQFTDLIGAQTITPVLSEYEFAPVSVKVTTAVSNIQFHMAGPQEQALLYVADKAKIAVAGKNKSLLQTVATGDFRYRDVDIARGTTATFNLDDFMNRLTIISTLDFVSDGEVKIVDAVTSTVTFEAKLEETGFNAPDGPALHGEYTNFHINLVKEFGNWRIKSIERRPEPPKLGNLPKFTIDPEITNSKAYQVGDYIKLRTGWTNSGDAAFYKLEAWLIDPKSLTSGSSNSGYASKYSHYTGLMNVGMPLTKPGMHKLVFKILYSIDGQNYQTGSEISFDIPVQ